MPVREAPASWLWAAMPRWFSCLQTPSCASLTKLVSPLPLLIPHWQGGSLHKPPHSLNEGGLDNLTLQTVHALALRPPQRLRALWCPLIARWLTARSWQQLGGIFASNRPLRMQRHIKVCLFTVLNEHVNADASAAQLDRLPLATVLHGYTVRTRDPVCFRVRTPGSTRNGSDA